MEKKILDKLEHWAEPLNKELNIDGTPIWEFYTQMFLTNNFPNRLFNYSIKNLQKSLKNGEIKNKRITSYLTRKAIISNENIKRNIRKNKKRTENKEPKILFFTQADKINNGNLKKIGNTLKEVKKQDIAKIFILSYVPIEKNSGHSLLKQDHMIYEYLTKELLEETRKQAGKLNSKWESIPEEKKISLLELEGKSLYYCLKEELNFLFSREFLHTVLVYYNSYKKILKEENIKLVCSVGAGSIYAITLYAAAKSLNIPTMIQQHGICFGYIEKNILNNTKFAVFGENSKKELREWSIDPKNIIITGASLFDEIIPVINNKDKEENLITILTDGFYIYGLVDKEEYFATIKKWVMEIQKVPNLKIIIKPHPEEKEHLAEYRELIKNFNNIELLETKSKEELYRLISKSKLIVNFGSTVALESMILNKPVITITNFHNSKIVEFERVIKRIMNSGASINVKKEEDISIPISQILENKDLQNKLKEKRDKFVKDSCYIIDGKSSQRTAEVIKHILDT
jgi:hypothetical protein